MLEMYQFVPDKKKSVPDSKALFYKDVPDVPDVPEEMRKLFNFYFLGVGKSIIVLSVSGIINDVVIDRLFFLFLI